MYDPLDMTMYTFMYESMDKKYNDNMDAAKQTIDITMYVFIDITKKILRQKAGYWGNRGAGYIYQS